ncbi:MAG: alkaline phosphatase family protein [Gammaproteobacteria bacterium]|nr:alkaline phosphatase family protein [Gammaproteobacteria bacterium]MCP5136687.1 alkaline phosphatase family protein [Gammaproteobacteria bacterium]
MSSRTPKAPRLSAVIFIDALGWDVLKGRQFLETELPYRKKMRSVFGFSSACVPSILSGLWPAQHRHWSFFYYSPKTSPFSALRPLALLPKSIMNRGRVRNLLSKVLKRLYGFTGYFQIYNIPFKYAHLFDYCEKKDLFKPGGLNAGENIFDHLERGKVPYHVSNWRESESSNLAAFKHDIAKGEIRFAFLYMAAMDGLLHMVGKESPKADEKLAWYEEQLREVLKVAHAHYEEVRLFICSDHGMATVHTNVDLMAKVAALGLAYGKDYVGTYDSTMGRFWFFNDTARERITELLNTVPEGRILSEQELHELGCDFPGHQYGEMIFLMNPGVMVVPSDMGETTITGMHGYHPDDIDSNASLLSNVPVGDEINAIPHVFNIMRAEAGV